MKKMNVALVGCWHPHVPRYYPILQKHPATALTVVWDSTPARGQEWAAKLGVPFEGDYDKLLARPDVDAVCIVAETALHKDLIVKAAKAGKHIFTEKTFCVTLAEAEEARAAVIASKVKFTIAYIRACTPGFALGKKMLDAGLLGDVNMMRIRNGVDTSKMNDLPPDWFTRKAAGGGALIDLGTHPFYLFDWMNGDAIDVCCKSISYYGNEVEDNVAALIRFKNGVLGVAESTASTFYSPYMFELYGRKATYLHRIDMPYVEIQLDEDKIDALKAILPAGIHLDIQILGGKVDNASVNTLFGARAIVKVPVAELEPIKEPLEQWIDSCTQDSPIEFGIESAYRLTKLIAAADHSRITGDTVKF